MQNLIVAAACTLAACSSGHADRTTNMSNTLETNRHAVRRLFEDGFNHGRQHVVAELVAEDYVDTAGGRGPAAFDQVMTRLRGAFPDIHYTIEDILAEDDRVAVRWHWSGTHRNPFRNAAPTNRALSNNGLAIFKLRRGQIVAATLETDRLGFLQNIGVVPGNDVLFAPSVR
jgi:steroid delta-isomerase-like uncharacterized protein